MVGSKYTFRQSAASVSPEVQSARHCARWDKSSLTFHFAEERSGSEAMTVSPLGVLAPIIEGEAVLPLPGIRLRFVPIGEFPALRREAISVTICRLIDASFNFFFDF